MAHSGIGNTLMLLPFIEEIRNANSDSRIFCTVNRYSREILEMAHLELEFISWPKYWRREPRGVLHGLSALTGAAPEVLVAPPGINLAWAAGVALISRARKRLGMLSTRHQRVRDLSYLSRRAFTDILPLCKDLHEVEYTLQALSIFGLPVVRKAPSLNVGKDARKVTSRRLKALTGMEMDHEPYFVAHLGCEPLLRFKLWPLEKMLRLLKEFSLQHRMRCLLLWGKTDTDLLENAMRMAAGENWLLPVPWEASLADTSALIFKSQLIISNDSGIMHLASALGTRVMAIFGPTDYSYCGPFGERSAVVFQRAACQPCYTGLCVFSCSTDRACLKELRNDAVLSAASRVLDDRLPSTIEQIAPGTFFAPSCYLSSYLDRASKRLKNLVVLE